MRIYPSFMSASVCLSLPLGIPQEPAKHETAPDELSPISLAVPADRHAVLLAKCSLVQPKRLFGEGASAFQAVSLLNELQPI